MNNMLLVGLIFLIAFLYASVGHGGASGYLALLSVAGLSPLLIKPSALFLNILVASVAFIQYYRAGNFRFKLFYPFALLSVPLAYFGSQLVIDTIWYKRILAVCLCFAAARLFGVFTKSNNDKANPLPLVAAILIGAILGLLSGLIGIGGGIILSPIILLFNWGNVKETAAVSALFIFVNSSAGIAGNFCTLTFEPQLILWALTAAFGGIAGSFWGSNQTSLPILKRTLAIVVVIAAIKLFFI